MKFDFTGLLKNEMKPALGVTEVGAIALAAARAYAAVFEVIFPIVSFANPE